MEWDLTEFEQLNAVQQAITECRAARDTDVKVKEILLDPARASASMKQLSCYSPGSIVLQIYEQLGFDASRLFLLRFEHKLIQAVVLQRYCPGQVPMTCGLNQFLTKNKITTRDQFDKYFNAECGLIIKRTLGYASGEKEKVNCKSIISETFEEVTKISSSPLCEGQKFIVQEWINSKTEYRVHSIESQVIPDLTFHRYNPLPLSKAKKVLVNNYVQSILDSLPSGLVNSAIYGWDVLETIDGSFIVLEANITGHHLHFEPGFHCSGYFLMPPWALTVCALFADFVERKYQISIRQIRSEEAIPELTDVYEWFGWWRELLRSSVAIFSLRASLASKQVSDPESPGSKWHNKYLEDTVIKLTKQIEWMSHFTEM